MAVSAEPSALLDAAHAIVGEQVARLRALIDPARQRVEQLEIELRQAERALDELVTQQRFAAERGQAPPANLVERERAIRTTYEKLSREQQSLKRALKQLDQLARQIDMSSSTLNGTAEGDASDPWAQALRSQVITGREEERSRLAREVHDGPAQVLANALMGLERSRNLLNEGKLEKVAEMLDRLSDNAREGLAEVRRFIADLRPGKLEQEGLAVALADYVRRYHNTINPRVTFEADTLPRMPSETEIVLYRVVQEALQNAHKHARGAPVHVVIICQSGHLSLTVRDEGPGFDPRVVARRAGRESWGLLSMRERAELVGAKLTVSSAPGHGTEVQIVMAVRW
jgi:two-component system, NarL family, sensor histidine kinase DegS